MIVLELFSFVYNIPVLILPLPLINFVFYRLLPIIIISWFIVYGYCNYLPYFGCGSSEE